MAADWQDDHQCVVCGSRNAHGLQLQFHADAEGAAAEGVVPEHLQGYAGRVHGGVIAAILDDAMYYAIAAQGLSGVTAEMKLRYRRPLDTGARFRVEAQCTKVTRRFGAATATLSCGGEVVAQAESIFMPGK